MAERATLNIGGRWNLRLVRRGDRFGLNDCLVHDDPDPMVEFFDASQDPERFTPLGQFVSRYYASTLLQPPAAGPLSLMGGVPAWTVSAKDMAAATAWVKEQTGN